MSDLSLKIAAVAAPVRQQVAETLRRAILGRHFQPGDRLVERELCELIGVSRTSIREALRHLEVEGYVQVVPNKGMIVASRDDDEMRQIVTLLGSMLGVLGQYFATGASARDVAELRHCYNRFRADLSHGNAERVADAGEALYLCLGEGAGNKPLVEMLDMLRHRAALGLAGVVPGTMQRGELDFHLDLADVAADVLERRSASVTRLTPAQERPGSVQERRVQATI